MDIPVIRPPEPAGVRIPRWDVRVAGALFLGWIVLARAGPMLELAPGVRAWYPPAALLAAACILWGARALIPIIAAASAVLVWRPDASGPLWRLLLVSAALKGLYWLASRALHARRFDFSFSSPGDVARFGAIFVGAGAVAALLSTVETLGVAGTLHPDALRLVRAFWIGDVVAVIALAPAVIVCAPWFARARSATLHQLGGRLRAMCSPRLAVQVVSVPLALLLSAALASTVGFFSFALCFLPLGWIALSHGARVAALTNAVITLGTVWLVHDGGIIAPKGLEIQAFVGMLALTGLLVGSVADERQRAFALLADSEERYRRLVELLPDPLLVHADGRVLFANSSAATVLGARDSAALVGVPLASLATPRSRGVIADRLRALGDGHAVPLTHHTLHRMDGSGTVDVESVSIPFAYQGLRAALTVARDVTTRVRLEEELRHAQRMEAVGRLAGGVAHDFNNLLTVIISYSELVLVQAGGDEGLARDVGEIRHAAERAAALTRQLLSFSRRQVLQAAPLQLNDVVRGAEAMLRRLIGPEIVIVSRLDPAAGVVLADRGQLEQVIMNLVVNARDAMPDGGTLTVATAMIPASAAPAAARAASPADHFVTILVRDTGTGMDAETMRCIFDPFFTTKEVGRGTGLGLATVHGIMQQSGGAVTVESEVGVGSEFRILLPALGGDAATPADDAPAPSARAVVPSSTWRVLLVEDDTYVREGVGRMLGAAGYDVVEAVDGAQALVALAAADGGFAVLLSDIAMPNVDGRQLALSVRAQWPLLPIVLMSGSADRDTLRRELPGVVLLQKPLELPVLVDAIQAAMQPR